MHISYLLQAFIFVIFNMSLFVNLKSIKFFETIDLAY